MEINGGIDRGMGGVVTSAVHRGRRLGESIAELGRRLPGCSGLPEFPVFEPHLPTCVHLRSHSAESLG